MKNQKLKLEQRINKALLTWKQSCDSDSSIAGKSLDKFLERLRALPLEYRTIYLQLILDPNCEADSEIEYRQKFMQLLTKESETHKLALLIPRWPSMEGVEASHGSPVRERYFSQGEIDTLRTNDNLDALIIFPQGFGVLPTYGDRARRRFNAKEISSITLATPRELPSYLTSPEVWWVNSFYRKIGTVKR